MAKYCCVVHCPSKSPDSQGDPVSLFKLPAESERREKWLEALTPHLRRGKASCKQLHICELHFKPEEVLRTLTLAYSHGQNKEIPRENVRLTATSVPSIFNSKGETEEIKHEELSQELPELEQQSELSEMLFEQCDENVFVEEDLPRDSVYTPQDPETDVSNNGLEQEHSDMQELETETIENIFIQQDSPHHSVYTLHDLETDVARNSSLEAMENWTITQLSNGLLFSYVDYGFTDPTRTVLVKEDMTIEIEAKGRHVEQTVVHQIDSFVDLITVIRIINGLALCVGVPDGPPCPYGLIKRENEKISQRCVACRRAHRNKRNREWRHINSNRKRKPEKQPFVKQRRYHRLSDNAYSSSSDLTTDEQGKIWQNNCPEKIEKNFYGLTVVIDPKNMTVTAKITSRF